MDSWRDSLRAIFATDDVHFFKHAVRNVAIFLVILAVALLLNWIHDRVEAMVTNNWVLLHAIRAVEYTILVVDVAWFTITLLLETLSLLLKTWRRTFPPKDGSR